MGRVQYVHDNNAATQLTMHSVQSCVTSGTVVVLLGNLTVLGMVALTNILSCIPQHLALLLWRHCTHSIKHMGCIKQCNL